MTKLICPECRKENESERIYCHECGAKLDRSKVIAAKPPDARVKEQKRVRNMFDARRAKMRLLFFKTCKMILGSCAAALVISMALPPDISPQKKDALSLSQIGMELENAVNYHRPPQLQYTEDQVNEYLFSTLKGKKALNKPMLDFKRALVGLSEGKCAITAERAIFGYSVFTTTVVGVQLADGKINVSNKGGAIGRLSIHPELMQYLDIVFADVWSALDRERKLVAKATAVEFHDKSVVLSTLPAASQLTPTPVPLAVPSAQPSATPASTP
jgi:hypothetical protein